MPISLAGLRPTLLAAGLFAAVPPAAAQDFSTERQQVRIDTVARGLVHPWGLGFLPDGRALVTERPGRLRIIAADGTTSPPVAGLPAIFARSQGGLLDVAVSPRFTDDRTIFVCFSEADGDLARSAMARGRLMIDGGGARLEDVRVIFRQQPATATAMHFGCRIAIRPDGTLFLTLGDHFRQMQAAQNLGSTIGKIVRVTADGAVPPDNPFVGRAGALPEIWSFGHRNVQAAAIEPASGRLWTAEHGARHGDEINRPEAGRNYGWPVISYGTHYSGERVGEGTRREGLEQPVFHWNDETIAPSGAAFVTSARFPAWRGNMLVGGLRSRILLRLEIADGRVVATERMLGGLQERIRDVRQGPDGAIWLLTDAPDGRLLRMTPRG